MIDHSAAFLPAGLAVGIEANLLTTGFLVLISYLVYLSYLMSRQRHLDLLFGLRNQAATVTIRTSRIDLGGGSSGTEPVTRGYAGAALTRPDYLAAALIADLLHRRPLLLVNTFRANSASNRRIVARLIRVSLDACPSSSEPENTFSTSSLVLVGGPIYNPLVFKYINNGQLFFDVQKNPATGLREFRPDASVSREELPAGRALDEKQSREIAVIERHWDTSNQRAILALYGLGARATAAASKLLVNQYSHFANLTRAFGGYHGSWAIMLSLPTSQAELPDEQDLSDIETITIERVITPDGIFTPKRPTGSVREVLAYLRSRKMRDI